MLKFQNKKLTATTGNGDIYHSPFSPTIEQDHSKWNLKTPKIRRLRLSVVMHNALFPF